MIATNLLLSIGFSIVSNFSAAVNLPPETVPKSVSDLRRLVLGTFISPVEIVMYDKRGNRFVICDGVVKSFSTKDSFHDLQDPRDIPKYFGEPALTTNQVVELATKTLERVTGPRNPVKGVVPFLSKHEDLDGRPIAFYSATWPSDEGRRYGAIMEIDARMGHVTLLDLEDKRFHDYEFAQEISNLVYTPDPPRQEPIRARVLPYPTTTDAIEAINGWRHLCSLLGLNPGVATNIAAIDWEKSYIYTNSVLAPGVPSCQLGFTNGAQLDSINGITCNYTAGDSCWSRPAAFDGLRFRGTIVKDWEQLARGLQTKLIEKCGVPKTMFDLVLPVERTPPPKVGTEDLTRLMVEWRRLPKDSAGRDVALDETEVLLIAEFDLTSGEVKWIMFRERDMFAAVARAQQSRS